MQQMTNMHVKRWKKHRHEIGYRRLDQGRSKSFPVKTHVVLHKSLTDEMRVVYDLFRRRRIRPDVYVG